MVYARLLATASFRERRACGSSRNMPSAARDCFPGISRRRRSGNRAAWFGLSLRVRIAPAGHSLRLASQLARSAVRPLRLHSRRRIQDLKHLLRRADLARILVQPLVVHRVLAIASKRSRVTSTSRKLAGKSQLGQERPRSRRPHPCRDAPSRRDQRLPFGVDGTVIAQHVRQHHARVSHAARRRYRRARDRSRGSRPSRPRRAPRDREPVPSEAFQPCVEIGRDALVASNDELEDFNAWLYMLAHRTSDLRAHAFGRMIERGMPVESHTHSGVCKVGAGSR